MKGRTWRWLAWAELMFGRVALDRRERLLRFIEEAVELGQSLGLDRAALAAIADRVYSGPPGAPAREFGQCLACFECLAHVVDIDADAEATAELRRVQAIPQAEWNRRHAAKVALGIALNKATAE